MQRSAPLVRISVPNAAGGYEQWDDDLTNRVASMTFVDKSSGADTMEIVFNNLDLALLDSPHFTWNKKLGVLFGYPEQTYGDGPVEMSITKVEGFTKFKVSGNASGTRAFIRRQRMTTWEATNEWDVAEEIASGLGYDSDHRQIDSTDMALVNRGITQASETDWAFLQRIAERVGCVCYLRDGVFHFHPPSLGRPPVKEIIYRGGDRATFLDDPKLEYTILGRGGRVTVAGTSTREREEVTGTAGNEDDQGRPVMGDAALAEDPVAWEELLRVTESERSQIDEEIHAQEEVRNENVESEEEARRKAQARFRRAEQAVKLEAPLVGDPELVADENLRISGIGTRFSGNYHLEEITHKISVSGSSVYTTKIKSSRNALSQSGVSGNRRRTTPEDAADDGQSIAHEWWPGEGGGSEVTGTVNDQPPPPQSIRWEQWPGEGDPVE